MNSCEYCKIETSEFKLSGIVLKVDEEYLLIKEPASNKFGFPKGRRFIKVEKLCFLFLDILKYLKMKHQFYLKA
jgi:hypothetical protein